MQKEAVSVVITQGHAEDLRPILKWIRDEAPRKDLRIQASSVLSKLEGIKEWRQIRLTRKEEQLIGAIHGAFPEGSIGEGKQGRLKGF